MNLVKKGFFFVFLLSLNLIVSAQNKNVFTRGLFMEGGKFELKVFNNLYTEVFPTNSDLRLRSNYFTSFVQTSFGTNKNINFGADLLYRSYLINVPHPNNPINVLRFSNSSKEFSYDSTSYTTWSAHELSHAGLRMRTIPFGSRRFTFQQSLYFPTGKLDNGFIVNTDLFYENIIKNKYMIFGDLGFWYNTSKLPFPYLKVFAGTLIFKRFGPYMMLNLPYEIGTGLKFFILPKLEIEFLYSYWLPFEFTVQNRRPQTFNFGIRYTNFNNFNKNMTSR